MGASIDVHRRSSQSSNDNPFPGEGEMNSTQDRKHVRLRTVKNVLADRPALTAADATSPATTGTTAADEALPRQIEALDGTLSRISAHATAQEIARTQTGLIARDQPRLRKDLTDMHLATIAQTARSLRGQVPGIGVLAMPARRSRNEVLVKNATAFGRKAEVYQDVLIEHGLPHDFVVQLDAATSAYQVSLDARGVAMASQRAATKGLTEEFDLGGRIVSMIDSILTRKLKNEPTELAAWRSAKRLPRRVPTMQPAAASAAAGHQPVSPPTGAAPAAVPASTGATSTT
jgi:hypothetical protein